MYLASVADVRYRILAGDDLIGTSDLAACDPPMAVLIGDFEPTEAYERVRPVFRLYATAGLSIQDQDPEKLRAYDFARDGLQLRLESEDGTQLPVSWVHIDDYFEEIGEYQTTIQTEDIGSFPHCKDALGAYWNAEE